MAGSGYRDWVAGDVPTAAQFDTFLQEQTNMRFASAAARDTALSLVKAEGMVAILDDTNTITVYSGSAWSTVGPVHGALSVHTPSVTQLGAVGVTVGSTATRCMRIGRLVTGWFSLAVTGAGTLGNPILIGAPHTAATSDFAVGSFEFFDLSGPGKYVGTLFMETTQTFSLRLSMGVSDNRIGTGLGIALASGDVINGQFSYMAAADA